MKDYYNRIVELSLKKCLKDDYGDRQNVQKHNRATMSLLKLISEMENIECRDILDKLLEHDDHRVRVSAAVACFKLKLLEDKAKLTLADIIDNPQDSTVSFEAEMIMRLAKLKSGEISSIFEDKLPAKYFDEKQYFSELNDKFVALYHKYRDSYKDLIKEVERKAYKTEFCKGGELIHRGYYSPSMSDLFFGNVKRGRLLKKVPIDCKFTYEYIFDEDNKLICVNKYDYSDDYLAHLTTEVFVYENDSVLAFTFSEGRILSHSLEAITECRYEDDRLIRYEIAHLSPNCSDSVNRIEVESFEYSDNFVVSVEWYSFNMGIELLKHKHFSLSRDENNYIVLITEDDISRRKRLGISKEENVVSYLIKTKRK